MTCTGPPVSRQILPKKQIKCFFLQLSNPTENSKQNIFTKKRESFTAETALVLLYQKKTYNK